MARQYLLGVDIGTQGTKTSLISTEGQLITDAFEASKLIRPAKGVVQQEPDDIYGSVLHTIAEVVSKSGVSPSDILAIGIDGQMAGVMGIDKDWNAATYYDSWLDTRCEKYIHQIKSEAEDQVVSITGCPVTYAHGPKILWWKYERPDLYKKIAKFVQPGGYVVGRLAGLKADEAYLDYTYLHFSGFGDVEHNRWSDELLALFEVAKDKMPEIVEPWKIVGSLSKEASQACGLLSGVPLVAGCGDSAATSLGAGITKRGLLFDIAGTASIFSCCVDQYKPDVATKTLLFAHSVLPGLWIPMAYINGGGMCLKWFRDNLTGEDVRVDYGELDKAAAEIPAGSEGLIFLPHFSGRVCPNNPYIRGTWLGLSWIHNRNHLYRAIMEGIAYEYYYYLKVLNKLVKNMEFSQVIAIGGGAKSPLFNSIKANVLGIKYSTLATSDTATLGGAILAGYGVKVFNNISETAERFSKIAAWIEPDLRERDKYKRYADNYEKTIDMLNPLFKIIN
jgi:xylulokinase